MFAVKTKWANSYESPVYSLTQTNLTPCKQLWQQLPCGSHVPPVFTLCRLKLIGSWFYVRLEDSPLLFWEISTFYKPINPQNNAPWRLTMVRDAGIRPAGERGQYNLQLPGKSSLLPNWVVLFPSASQASASSFTRERVYKSSMPLNWIGESLGNDIIHLTQQKKKKKKELKR